MIMYLLNPADNRFVIWACFLLLPFFSLSFPPTKLNSLQGPEQDSVHLTEDSTKEALILYPISSSRLPQLTHQPNMYKTMRTMSLDQVCWVTDSRRDG